MDREPIKNVQARAEKIKYIPGMENPGSVDSRKALEEYLRNIENAAIKEKDKAMQVIIGQTDAERNIISEKDRLLLAADIEAAFKNFVIEKDEISRETLPMRGDIPQKRSGGIARPNKPETVSKAPTKREMGPNMEFLSTRLDKILDNPNLLPHQKFEKIETTLINDSKRILDMFGLIHWAQGPEGVEWKKRDNGLFKDEVNQITQKAIEQFITIAEGKMDPVKWDSDLAKLSTQQSKELSIFLKGEVDALTFMYKDPKQGFKRDEIMSKIRNLNKVRSKLTEISKELNA